MIEQNHLDLLLDLNTDENSHSGGDLLDHLRGTKEGATVWNRVHEEHTPITQADLRDLIEMEVANYLEFMPRSHFTVEELDTFEAKVERGKPFLSPLAYEAIKAGIRSKRLAIAS